MPLRLANRSQRGGGLNVLALTRYGDLGCLRNAVPMAVCLDFQRIHTVRVLTVVLVQPANVLFNYD